MDYETVSAEDFGRSLSGIGLNLLVRDIARHVDFLTEVFEMSAHRVSTDFAIMTYGAGVFQLHADRTYHSNPYFRLLPETPPRGAGVEIRLYDTDPAAACARAEKFEAVILQPPTDKPHGLNEAYILCPDGYAWVPSKRLVD